MKMFRNRRAGRQAYALMLTIIIIAVAMLVVAATLRLTSGECRITGRNNTYNAAVAAAEAGTERVIAQMQRDFNFQSLSSDLEQYATVIPDQAGWPTQFEFSDPSGNKGRALVTSGGSTMGTNLPSWTTLNSSYPGLYGIVMPYEVTSRATAVGQLDTVSATVEQKFQLALIPVFQFAAFYNMDLEIHPGPDMDITGKVHSNDNIYTAPGAKLNYLSDVTAVGKLIRSRHPEDPNQGKGNDPNYIARHEGGVGSMSLPIGVDNSPGAVAAILDPPAFGESPNSPLGALRFHNNSDLLITRAADGEIVVKSGAWNKFTALPKDGMTIAGGKTNAFYTFVSTGSFYDFRENKTVQALQLDVGKLKAWMANTDSTGGAGINDIAKFSMNHELNSIYVHDALANVGASMNGVRVVNGSDLPDAGLTVATPHPLYVQGHFNVNNGDTTPGLKDTSKTKPAALIGDAITVLSGDWSDSYASTSALGHRRASDTTVNAAFLSGIVTTKQAGGAKYYSGGLENFPRFLENWSGTSLTYNGSMVVMFPSRHATSFWQSPGNYYNPPKRLWAFDNNFLDHRRLPPLTPMVRKLIRDGWEVL